MAKVAPIALLTALAVTHEPAPRACDDILRFASMGEQEFSEDGALDRFELDELFLPILNIELPALFEWVDAENVYLADSTRTDVRDDSGRRDA